MQASIAPFERPGVYGSIRNPSIYAKGFRYVCHRVADNFSSRARLDTVVASIVELGMALIFRRKYRLKASSAMFGGTTRH